MEGGFYLTLTMILMLLITRMSDYKCKQSPGRVQPSHVGGDDDLTFTHGTHSTHAYMPIDIV